MQTYETYKHSGIDWLGEIPAHWSSKKMKYLFIDFSKKNMPNETLLSVTQNQGVVPRDWVENRMVMPSGNLESFKYIEKGDFCISLRSFEGGLEYCFHSGIVSPAYTVLKGIFNHFDGYYKYLFKSQIFIDELQLSIVGIREGKNISYELLRYDFLPIPPIHEQEAIATFLDDKCAKIEALLEIKAQQIEKLKELRQVKIHQAVTKGLDANVALIDSGIDWIGEIPKHWEVKRLKSITDFVNRGSAPSYVEQSDFYVINQATFSKGFFDLSTIKYAQSTYLEFDKNRGKVLNNDLLIASTGGGVLGKVALYENIEGNFIADSHVTIVRSNNTHGLNKFLYFFFSINYNLINGVLAQGSTNQTELQRSWLLDFVIPIPPLSEQEAIVAYLEEVTGKIDQVLAQKQEQIEKLKQYKQSLINEVVTGKLRVC